MYHQGRYCLDKKENGKAMKTPLEPQPSEGNILVLKRYYSTLKVNGSYKRRTTWIEKLPHCISEDVNILYYALVEYSGVYTGLSSHGHSHSNTPYIRSSKVTMDKIDSKVLLKTSKEIYHKVLSEGYANMRDEKQIQNRKYLFNKRQTHVGCNWHNEADHIQTVMSMLGTHPMV